MRTLLGCTFIIVMLTQFEAPATAQQPRPADARLEWTTRTARAAGGTFERAAFLPVRRLALSDGPTPMGLFWTAGNPAAAPLEVSGSFAEISARAGSVGGDFHRPLDAPAESVQGADALAWHQPAPGSGLAGGVSYERRQVDPGMPSLQREAYGGTPFVVTDSTLTPHQSALVTLDGAGGWSVGRTSLGLAVGYVAEDARTTASRVPRFSRGSQADITAGVVRTSAGGGTRYGVHARWGQSTQTLRIATSGGMALVTLLHGLAPPTSFSVSGSTSPPWFYRRIEEVRRGLGVAAAGVASDWHWVASGEYGGGDERSWSIERLDPPQDTWTTEALQTRVAAHRSFADGQRLLTLRAGWLRSEGEGAIADSAMALHAAAEARVESAVELRVLPTGSRWRFLTAIEAAFEQREHSVPETQLAIAIDALSLRLTAEVAHAPTSTADVAAGISVAHYAPAGRMPRAQHLPAGARPLLAGEAAFSGTPRLAYGGILAATWQVRPATALRVAGGYQHASPRSRGAALEFAPQGERNAWELSLGVVLQ